MRNLINNGNDNYDISADFLNSGHSRDVARTAGVCPEQSFILLPHLFNAGDHREPKGLRQFHLWQEWQDTKCAPGGKYTSGCEHVDVGMKVDQITEVLKRHRVFPHLVSV